MVRNIQRRLPRLIGLVMVGICCTVSSQDNTTSTQQVAPTTSSQQQSATTMVLPTTVPGVSHRSQPFPDPRPLLPHSPSSSSLIAEAGSLFRVVRHQPGPAPAATHEQPPFRTNHRSTLQRCVESTLYWADLELLQHRHPTAMQTMSYVPFCWPVICCLAAATILADCVRPLLMRTLLSDREGVQVPVLWNLLQHNLQVVLAPPVLLSEIVLLWLSQSMLIEQRLTMPLHFPNLSTGGEIFTNVYSGVATLIPDSSMTSNQQSVQLGNVSQLLHDFDGMIQGQHTASEITDVITLVVGGETGDNIIAIHQTQTDTYALVILEGQACLLSGVAIDFLAESIERSVTATESDREDIMLYRIFLRTRHTE